jgi:hypothetical protein
MVDQQAVRIKQPFVPVEDAPKQLEETDVIRFVAEHDLARVASDDDVVNGTGVADAMGPSDLVDASPPDEASLLAVDELSRFRHSGDLLECKT